MADQYIYEEDGKIHTRYSELKRCTPGGAEAVVLERLGLLQKYSGGKATNFGTDRHEMWEEESRKTRKVPECFEYCLLRYGIPKDTPLAYVEDEIKYEIFPGIILHGTPDSVSSAVNTVFDNKTITGRADQFRTSDQLLVYSYLLYKLGLPIKQGIYLCELWSTDHKRILGYDSYRKEFGLSAVSVAEKWLRDRAEVLLTAIDVVKARTSEI